MCYFYEVILLYIQCNTDYPTTDFPTTRVIRHFLLGPAKILSIPCILPRFIRHFTTDYPTTRVIRHFFAGPKRNFTTDYPTFFVTSRESREKIEMCVRAIYSMTIQVHVWGYFSFCPGLCSKKCKQMIFFISKLLFFTSF